MFTTRTLVLCLAACLLTIDAAAQTQPATRAVYDPPATSGEPRVFFHLNVLAEPGSQDLTSTSAFQLYEEPGQFEVRRRIEGTSAVDVGVSYRLGLHFRDGLLRNLGVGFGYTASSDEGDATVIGSVPHPLFFDRPRAFAIDVPGLEQRERAVHLQATWYMPITTAWDVTLFLGPSFLNARLEQVSDVQIGEVGPPFTSVNVVPAMATRSGSGTGLNIGADTTYVFLRDLGVIRGVGAGLTLRYAGGSVDIDQPGGSSQSVDVGGFQIGGGLRVRF